MAKDEKMIGDDMYFALQPTENIGDCLIKRVNDYYEHIHKTSRLKLWKKAYREFYKGYYNKGEVLKEGKSGEKRKLEVNNFRNYLQRLKSMTTNQIPSFEVRATNTDHESQAQTLLAKNIIDYYMKVKNVKRHTDDAVDKALKYGEGWLMMEWDHQGGPLYWPKPDDAEPGEAAEQFVEDEKETQKEAAKQAKEAASPEEKDAIERGANKHIGEIEFSTYGPIDIIREFSLRNTEGHNWYIVCQYKDKFDVAQQYPKYYDDILAAGTEYKWERFIAEDDELFQDSDYKNTIPVYTFFHERTNLVPNGRMVKFLSNKGVIFDSGLDKGLPYTEIPLYKLIPAPQDKTSFGYATAFDLLPICISHNMLHSNIVSNQNAFGMQNILVPDGCNIRRNQVEGGLNFLKYNPAIGKPEPLNLIQTAPETFEYDGRLDEVEQRISGVSAIGMGENPVGVKSGSHAALIHSQMIQFNHDLQMAYDSFLENAASGLLYIIKVFASAPRKIELVGKANIQYMEDFDNSKIQDVQRVIVDTGSPMAKTLEGRIGMARDFMEMGFIQNMEQYVTVVNTGRTDAMTEGIQSELMSIRQENEEMANGQPQRAVWTENHFLHIQSHTKDFLNNPVTKRDENITAIGLEHVQEHFDIWSDYSINNPEALIATGQQPLTGGSPAMPGPEGAPPEGGGEPEGAMPNLPANPSTGEKYNPEEGI